MTLFTFTPLLRLAMFALVASAASPDECAFLAKRFSAFPQPGRGAWKRVFVNATFEPRADGPRHYPTADDIFKLFYHGRRSPCRPTGA